MTRLLVTGGAGFIGSHYVRTLLGPGGPGDVRVTVLDKLTYAGHTESLRPVRHHPGFRFVRGDVCDADLVGRLVAEHDGIVHFAAESHVDRSIECPGAVVRTNVLGTSTLAEAALRRPGGAIPLLQVSTDEVYGTISHGSWPESDPLRPSSPYSAAKAGGDLLALAFHRTFGLDVRVTRCANNYGPYQHPEKVVPLFVTNLLDGRTVPLYGDGSNVRDWLHVDDHVRAIELVRLGGRPGDVYNVGGGTELSNIELTRRLLAVSGAGWDMVEHVEDRKGHDFRYSVDSTKIMAELGYRPRVDLERGLRETYAWYRDNREWWEPIKNGAGSVSARGSSRS